MQNLNEQSAKFREKTRLNLFETVLLAYMNSDSWFHGFQPTKVFKTG